MGSTWRSAWAQEPLILGKKDGGHPDVSDPPDTGAQTRPLPGASTHYLRTISPSIHPIPLQSRTKQRTKSLKVLKVERDKQYLNLQRTNNHKALTQLYKVHVLLFYSDKS